jgi:hypothetical protein
MTPERMAELVARWVRFYTRDLPTPIAQRRVDEIAADLHDQIAHERADGTSERRIALGIVSRTARGLAADAAWRGRAKATAARSYRSVRVALPALLLLLPLLAMQITDEVVWNLADFAAAGALLVGTGLAYQLAARKAGNSAYRVAFAIALAAALLLVWTTLAVGIIGEPDDRANAMYVGVLAVGIAGAGIARLRPRGMARALLATALAQALVAVLALIAGKAQPPVGSVSEIVGLNGFFVVLFVGSAWLFRHVARRQPPADAGLAASSMHSRR